jgi:hypothetical protein
LFWCFDSQKDSNTKKESFVARNLKDYLPNLPLNSGKAKTKIKVFLAFRRLTISTTHA